MGRTMIEWDEVKSSNIAAVGYDKDELRYVYIRFLNGSVYRYDGVSDEHYEGMMHADSVGRYFNEHIKGAYQYEKIA